MKRSCFIVHRWGVGVEALAGSDTGLCSGNKTFVEKQEESRF